MSEERLVAVATCLEFLEKDFVAIATRLEFLWNANATSLEFLRKVSLQLLLVLNF